MAHKQLTVERGKTPNPKGVQKDNEKIENLAIDLKHGVSSNRSLGFQAQGTSLIEGLNQAADYALIKRLQLRSAKYLKLIDLNYKPYPEYRDLMFNAVNEFMGALTAIIVSVYRNNNPVVYKKQKYYSLLDSSIEHATQELFRALGPLSTMISESGYSGL